VEFETVEPPHSRLAYRGQSLKDLVVLDALVLADLHSGGIHKGNTRA